MGVEGKTIACLVGKETDTIEFEPIVRRLEEAGVTYVIVAPDLDALTRICLAGDCPVSCGLAVGAAQNMAFDALLVPSGNGVDAFLHEDAALDFVRHFARTGRPLAAIGRGVLLLAAADVLEARHVAAPENLRREVEAVGGVLVDGPYFKEVTDGCWITAKGADQGMTVAEAICCALEAAVAPSPDRRA